MMTLRKWQSTVKDADNMIVQASSKDGSDSWQPFPIGMSWQYYHNAKKGQTLQLGHHLNTVMCSISATTDKNRRPHGINRRQILVNISKNKIHNTIIDHSQYFDILPNYKFVISPEGNGIDCHRHYEALMAGCIPIIERNSLIDKKYLGCPILYTTDYSEITEDYLDEQYEKMIDQQYDFSRLFLSSYSNDEKEHIKDYGNYWIQRLTGGKWY